MGQGRWEGLSAVTLSAVSAAPVLPRSRQRPLGGTQRGSVAAHCPLHSASRPTLFRHRSRGLTQFCSLYHSSWGSRGAHSAVCCATVIGHSKFLRG